MVNRKIDQSFYVVEKNIHVTIETLIRLECCLEHYLVRAATSAQRSTPDLTTYGSAIDQTKSPPFFNCRPIVAEGLAVCLQYLR